VHGAVAPARYQRERFMPDAARVRTGCRPADEQARLAAVRAQLGALEQQQIGDTEARMKGLHEMSAALQVRPAATQLHLRVVRCCFDNACLQISPTRRAAPASWQAEQQARLEAQLEANRHKKRLHSLEAELTQQRGAMTQVCVLCGCRLRVCAWVLWGVRTKPSPLPHPPPPPPLLYAAGAGGQGACRGGRRHVSGSARCS
jgi:hypothetical protein